MARRFQKQIMQPGTWGGITVTADRIKHWAGQAKKMLENGILIPCPYFHDKDAKPIRRTSIDDANTRNNAGFWDKIWVDANNTLWGEVEAVDDDSASKIGKAARQVSLAAEPKWTEKDTEFEDVITHIALTNKAKAPTGDEFVPVVSMSDGFPFEVFSLEMADDLASTPDVGNEAKAVGLDSVLELLSEHGLELPPDTSEMNFLDRLNTALIAVRSHKKETEGEDLTQAPKGAKAQRPSPVAMSHELEFAVELLKSAKITDPETKTEFTVEGLKAAAEAKRKEAYVAMSAEDQAQVNWAKQQAVQKISDRAKTCVEEMRVSPALAKSFVDRLNVSFPIVFSEDGQQEPQWYDFVLSAWESIPKGAVTQTTHDGQFAVNFDSAKMRVEPREEAEEEMTEADAEKKADAILSGEY